MVAWRTAYQIPPTTQPTCQSTLIVAASVARSSGRTCSIANAVKIGLPAFMSEFRMAIARMTIHRIGRKPEDDQERDARRLDDDHRGDLAVPTGQARLGEDRGDRPEAGDREHGVERGQVETELALDEEIQERDDLARPDRDQEARHEQPGEPVRGRGRRGPAGPWPAWVRREGGWLAERREPGPATVRGRSSLSSATVAREATRSTAMITRMTR